LEDILKHSIKFTVKSVEQVQLLECIEHFNDGWLFPDTEIGMSGNFKMASEYFAVNKSSR